MHTIPSHDHHAVNHVLEHGKNVRIPCPDVRAQRAKLVRLNRWRKQNLPARPALAYVRFCPRQDDRGFYVLVEYDASYHVELEDEDGNLLGFTLADLAEDERKRQEEEAAREAERQEAEVPEHEREKLMRDLGLTEDDISGSELTETQEMALAEAKKQKGRELTEEERQHVINATRKDDGGLDL